MQTGMGEDTGITLAIHKPRREVSEDNPINTLISDFQSPELPGNKFLLLHPSHLWYFVMATPANWYSSQRKRERRRSFFSLASSVHPHGHIHSLKFWIYGISPKRARQSTVRWLNMQSTMAAPPWAFLCLPQEGACGEDTGSRASL